MQASQAAPSPEDVQTQLAITNRSLGIQTSFPGPKPALSKESEGWHGQVGDIFLWVTVVLAAIALAIVLKDILPGGYARRAKWQMVRGISPEADQAVSRGEVANTADELARQGLFGEAIHLLLLTSLTDLRRRLDVTIADSLTSREILRYVTLNDDAKQAFASLVRSAEQAHFGDYAVEAADYVDCRASFDRLSATLEAGRAA